MRPWDFCEKRSGKTVSFEDPRRAVAGEFEDEVQNRSLQATESCSDSKLYVANWVIFISLAYLAGKWDELLQMGLIIDKAMQLHPLAAPQGPSSSLVQYDVTAFSQLD